MPRDQSSSGTAFPGLFVLAHADDCLKLLYRSRSGRRHLQIRRLILENVLRPQTAQDCSDYTAYR